MKTLTDFGRSCLVLLLKILFSVRYKRVVIENPAIPKRPKDKRGWLIVANHTSLMDGSLIGITLWSKFKAFPLIVEEYYNDPAVHWLLSFSGSIPIPNFTSGNFDLKEAHLKKTLEEVSERINKGESIYIFPSGRMKDTGEERLGGASFLTRLLKINPQISILSVSLTGMWGSSFSYAYTGSYPSLFHNLGTRIFQVILNGIFFMPKRSVILEIKEQKTLPLLKDKIEINTYLENFFNSSHKGGEPLVYRPYYFWQNIKHRIEPKTQCPEIHLNESVKKRLLDDIAELFSLPRDAITEKSKLGIDLGLDSLDLAKLACHLETQHDLGAISLDDLYTVEQIFQWVQGKYPLKRPTVLKKLIEPKKLTEERKLLISPVQGSAWESIAYFATKYPSMHACGDLWNPPITYKELLKAVLKQSRSFAKIASPKVAILMLNSIEATITLLALQHASKTPILLDPKKGQLSPSIPILTHNEFLNSLNQFNLDGLQKQFITPEWQSKIPLEAFSEEGELFEDYPLPELSLPINASVALIHSNRSPLEAAWNLKFLALGHPVFYLSTYRVSSREIAAFLEKGGIRYAIAEPPMYQRLLNQKLSQTTLLELR